ncbi:unnamed protein product [Durusdinium trenchii]|uniref:Ankyrin repeat domain-containing protein n=1 Tax=Durusdinium trenchii TaxID=1381693 RepID=A0ABP0MYG2_9DINO
MSVLGVVCVALWLVPACGHRVVNGQAAEVEIQHVIHQDGVEATTKTVVAAAATGMTLPKLKKSFTEEELKTSVLANVVEVFWNLDLDDYNMLHLSSALGELAAMQALVSAGADVNAKCTEKGPTPFTPRDMAKNEDAIVLLACNGGSRAGHYKHQALADAADIGYPHLTQILLAAGWDTEVRSEFGYTPLHIAVDCPPPESEWAGSKYWKERLEVMKLLVAGGADVNAEVNEKSPKTSKGGWTARDVAWYNGNKEADKYLTEHGGKRNAKFNAAWQAWLKS